jgi:hypothetical protein
MIQPIPRHSVLKEDGYFVWGGSMVRTDDGMCHLFYCRWPKAFLRWSSDGEIAYATAKKPSGPYKFQRVILGRRGEKGEFWDGFCIYNPQILHMDAKYYLYYAANNGSIRRTGPKDRVRTQRIGVAVADHPSGPWTRMDKPLIDISSGGVDSNFLNNPAVTRTPEGKVLIVYKCGGGKGGKLPVSHTTAIAEAPLGPFVKSNKRIFVKEGVRFPAEDPFIWCQDGKFYAILKDMHGTFSGVKGKSLVQFESSDGEEWVPSNPALVSECKLKWEDGQVDSVGRLERPQLWLNNGRPAILFLAVLHKGRSFNVHVPLKEPTETSATGQGDRPDRK